MKTIVAILAVLFLLPVVANAADDWSKRDVLLEFAWQAIHFTDWMQTRYIANHPDQYYETNPLLGAHPSAQLVDAYMLSWSLGHLAITHFLPKEYRPWFQYISIGVSGFCVARNYSIGIRVPF